MTHRRHRQRFSQPGTGLIVIVTDEAKAPDGSDPMVPTGIDATARSGQQSGPNIAYPGLSGPGGGRVRAVVLAPCIQVGTVDKAPLNRYSLLRNIEDSLVSPTLDTRPNLGWRR